MSKMGKTDREREGRGESACERQIEREKEGEIMHVKDR